MIEVEEHVVYIDLYDLEIVVLCGETYEILSDFAQSTHHVDLGEEQYIGQCTTSSYSEFTLTVILAYVRKEINPGLIAHEIFHAIDEIAMYYNLEGEALAYLTDYLNNNVSVIFKEQLLTWYNN